ncbi:ATP-binding protein [Limosilactobacillus sp.]|jgi:predicted AAA+ superfamily ATPase|uniref:ATP-binding protein n=1 Tax=Limosilactobacillus sp. TaxID=2773925 RepID=UPI0025C09358|nr:AAA family ATPase [Limosilactobacillus sp.]MCH3921376.1 AAA family ATPase [Limosilactobacillus sp.]MCH3928147.1 AAA family ATPase [Limosilactobacillus sp.]
MFVRNLQLDQLEKYADSQLIKVISGVHRSGKTVLLQQLKDRLRRQGVSNDQFQFIRFGQQLASGADLWNTIESRLVAGKPNYLLLDEFDYLPEIIPLLQRLLKDGRANVFITAASRSFLKRLAPLEERCVTIPVLPLGFAEFCQYRNLPASSHSLYQYLNRGGFPFAQEVHGSLELANYLDGVVNTAIVSGFSQPGTLCNPFLTKQLAIFLAGQVGSPVNVSQAVTGLKRAGIPASNKTLATYLGFLQDVFLFYPCHELNPATNKVKPTNVKYYPVDLSLRNFWTNQKGVLSQTNLEALLFIELVRRGYRVYAGKHCTFIAERDSERSYIQFVYSLRNQRAYDRAAAGLAALPDSAKRSLIVMQAPEMFEVNPAIRPLALLDWLCQPEQS